MIIQIFRLHSSTFLIPNPLLLATSKPAGFTILRFAAAGDTTSPPFSPSVHRLIHRHLHWGQRSSPQHKPQYISYTDSATSPRRTNYRPLQYNLSIGTGTRSVSYPPVQSPSSEPSLPPYTYTYTHKHARSDRQPSLKDLNSNEEKTDNMTSSFLRVPFVRYSRRGASGQHPIRKGETPPPPATSYRTQKSSKPLRVGGSKLLFCFPWVVPQTRNTITRLQFDIFHTSDRIYGFMILDRRGIIEPYVTSVDFSSQLGGNEGRWPHAKSPNQKPLLVTSHWG